MSLVAFSVLCYPCVSVLNTSIAALIIGHGLACVKYEVNQLGCSVALFTKSCMYMYNVMSVYIYTELLILIAQALNHNYYDECP